ncbi:conjugative transposon protein TraM [Massilibacteroides vaginae]|nr:conjugative transposon protein TraM [Massilibacteroides vaginae]
MKKYAIFALMVVIFGACLWLIFAPSADEKAKTEATQGFNANIPMPKEEGIIGDKESAYEDERMNQKKNEKMRSLQDFADMLGGEKEKPSSDLVLMDNEPTAQKSGGYTSQKQRPSSIQTSVSAYKDINRTLGNFYESPKDDPEKERLVKELEEIKAKMAESESKKNSVDEQMALMEKSYQIAAKYMPQMQGQSMEANGQPASSGQTNSRNASGKTQVVPVSQVTERTVSALQQDMSSADIVKAFSQPRNMGFLTATAEKQAEAKNTITACVHDEQTILNGQSVRLRLLEPMKAGNILIPRNTLITGMGKIQGERLDVIINSLEYEGSIISVQIMVYDTDGQQGVFIPNTAEVNAAKEIVANMGASAGTSISLTSDAGQQLAADLGRGLIQGTSQFVSKKLREVKVNLKAGYRVFLLPNEK